MNKIYTEGPSITQTEIDIVQDALHNGWYEHAYDYLENFQIDFAKYIGRKYCLMTCNGTSAIHLLLMGLGIGPGDEVIVPDLTWMASAAPISYVGATPIIVDVDIYTWCISLESIIEHVTPKTKAIIAVDLYGNMPNYQDLQRFCEENNIYLIEDSCEALGSVYLCKKAGTFGIGSAFSFHRTKTICCGEGGALLLDDEDLYKKCFKLRNHGRDHTYSYKTDTIGHKFLPSNLTAALAYAQLKRIDELLRIKRHHAIKYSSLSTKVMMPKNYSFQNRDGGHWVTSLYLPWPGPTADEFVAKMKIRDIPIRRFFYPLTTLKPWCKYDFSLGNKNSYSLSEKGINFPAAYNLTDEQLDFIVKNAAEVIKEYV